MNQLLIYNLAVGAVVVHRYALLRVVKHSADEPATRLATVRTTSKQGVGTKLGTVDWRPIGAERLVIASAEELAGTLQFGQHIALAVVD